MADNSKIESFDKGAGDSAGDQADSSLAQSLWNEIQSFAGLNEPDRPGEDEVTSLDFSAGNIYGDAGNTAAGERPAVGGSAGDGATAAASGGAGLSDYLPGFVKDLASAEATGSWLEDPLGNLKDAWNKLWTEEPADGKAESKAEAPASAELPPGALSERALTVAGADYRGEGIKQSFEPSTHTWFKDDSLDEIARRRLGKNASEEDVRKLASEIKALNGIEDESKLADFTELEIPGHTADGAIVRGYKDGSTLTIAADGSTKYQSKEGWGYEMKPLPGGGYSERHFGEKPEQNYELTRRPDGAGGYIEKHTGSRPEDNYEITRTKDGKYLIADATTQEPVDKTNDTTDPRLERAKLGDLAEAKISDPEDRVEFRHNLERFEDRAITDKVAGSQQAEFYKEVRAMLEAGDNPGNADLPKEKDRLRLAEQMVLHAAKPQEIDQGGNSTCGAASLEARLFTTNPGDAARLITEVATTGQFTPADGSPPVRPDASLLRPDKEAQKEPTPDGDRTYASQLFQGAAITSQERFRSYRLVPESSPGSSKEVWTDYSENGIFGTTKDFKGVFPDEVQSMEKKITGDSHSVPIIEHDNINAGDSQIHVGSARELSDQLKDLQAKGELPCIVFVHTKNEPFWTDSRGGEAGGSGGFHFVTVTGFDASTGRVSIDNQWGQEADHRGQGDISVAELYHATIEPTRETVAELKKEAQEKRKAGQADYSVELEVMRQEKELGIISEEQFIAQLKRTMTEFSIKSRSGMSRPDYNWDQSGRVNRQFDQILAKYPDDKAEEIRQDILAAEDAHFEKKASKR